MRTQPTPTSDPEADPFAQQISDAGRLKRPQDEPVAHGNPAGDDTVAHLGNAGAAAGQAAGHTTAADEASKIAEHEARETPNSGKSALSLREVFLRSVTDLAATLSQLNDLLREQRTSTRFDRRKALLLLVLLAFADTALNATAAILNGDHPILAVISFIGIAAAIVAHGWFCGYNFRRAYDAIRNGPPPRAAIDLHAQSAFAKPSDKYRMISMIVFLLIGVVLAGWGVAQLRVESGFTPVFGLFSALVNIGAACLAFMTTDHAKNLLTSVQLELGEARTRLAEEDARVDHALALEALTNGAIDAAVHRVAAQIENVAMHTDLAFNAAPETYGTLTKPAARPRLDTTTVTSQAIRTTPRRSRVHLDDATSHAPDSGTEAGPATDAAEGFDPEADALRQAEQAITGSH